MDKWKVYFALISGTRKTRQYGAGYYTHDSLSDYVQLLEKHETYVVVNKDSYEALQYSVMNVAVPVKNMRYRKKLIISLILMISGSYTMMLVLVTDHVRDLQLECN